MSNALRGESSFTVNGETLTITMDADALCMAENVAGKPISMVVGLFDTGLHLGMTAALAWAGMFRRYGFPYEGFADRVMQWGPAGVRSAVAEAMRHAWPEKEEAENPPKRGQTKKTAGTGSNS